MSYLVKWTDKASEGLERAYFFLAEKNEDAAKNALKNIKEKVLLLEKFPNIGMPADDLDPEHRELLIPFGVSGYVLIYEVIENNINILAFKHQKEVGY